MADPSIVAIALNDWIIPASCGICATRADSNEINLESSIWKKASICASIMALPASGDIPFEGGIIVEDCIIVDGGMGFEEAIPPFIPIMELPMPVEGKLRSSSASSIGRKDGDRDDCCSRDVCQKRRNQLRMMNSLLKGTRNTFAK